MRKFHVAVVQQEQRNVQNARVKMFLFDRQSFMGKIVKDD